LVWLGLAGAGWCWVAYGVMMAERCKGSWQGPRAGLPGGPCWGAGGCPGSPCVYCTCRQGPAHSCCPYVSSSPPRSWRPAAVWWQSSRALCTRSSAAFVAAAAPAALSCTDTPHPCFLTPPLSPPPTQAAVIIENMAKLVDNPLDAAPFLPLLLPGLDKVRRCWRCRPPSVCVCVCGPVVCTRAERQAQRPPHPCCSLVAPTHQTNRIRWPTRSPTPSAAPWRRAP
jgi:hypothetical protein